MARLQFALKVSNLEAKANVYSKLFSSMPAKLHQSNANFSVTDPTLKLVLIEGTPGSSMNHLGGEVDSSGEVATAIEALRNFETEYESEVETTPCCAVQDKVWTTGPGAESGEIFSVTEDVDSSLGHPGRFEAEGADTIDLPKQHRC